MSLSRPASPGRSAMPPPHPAATKTRRRQRTPSVPPPSMSQFTGLLKYSALLAFFVWLLSTNGNGTTNGAALVKGIETDAQHVNQWVSNHAPHRRRSPQTSTHLTDAVYKPPLAASEDDEDVDDDDNDGDDDGDDDDNHDAWEEKGLPAGTGKSANQMQKQREGRRSSIRKRVSSALRPIRRRHRDGDYDEGPDAPSSGGEGRAMLFTILSCLGSFLASIFHLISYIFLPLTLPVATLWHVTVVLPGRMVLAIASALSPIAVFLGICALVGGLAGFGASGVLRGFQMLLVGGGGGSSQRGEKPRWSTDEKGKGVSGRGAIGHERGKGSVVPGKLRDPRR